MRIFKLILQNFPGGMPPRRQKRSCLGTSPKGDETLPPLGNFLLAPLNIAYLEKTLSRSIGIFHRIRQCQSDSALYFSFVYNHLQFAIGAWGGVGITTLNPVL